MKGNPTRAVRVGCCGFGLAQAKYFRAFDCVEINTSFYNLPQLATAARWRAAVPATFQFTMKAWQVITHPANSPTYKRTRLDERDREYCGHLGFNPSVRWAWEQTFAVAQELAAAVVVFQCPASFRPTKENLGRARQFFERAKRGKLRFGWEPRGAWESEQVGALCRELDLIHVVDPFQTPSADTGKYRYYRLHGVTAAQEPFTEAELQQLRKWCEERPVAWCFFNNRPMATDAPRFRALLGDR